MNELLSGPTDSYTGARYRYMASGAKPQEVAQITVPPAAVPSLVYDTLEHALATAGVSENGDIEYALGDDAVTEPPTNAWSKDMPKATNAGTYYVWYRIQETDDHTGVDPACIEVKIAKADATAIEAGEKVTATYGDSPIARPAKVTGVAGEDISSDCSIVYGWASNGVVELDSKGTITFTSAGTNTVTTDIGRINNSNYNEFSSLSDTYEVKVSPANINNANVVLEPPSFVYDDTAKEPAVKATLPSDKELVAGTDYDVSYSNNVNAGTATATITGKGNCTGSKSVEFQIAAEGIAVPFAISGLTYDGTEKTGVAEGEGYTLEGDISATDAGTYTVTAKLKDPNSVQWADGTIDDKTIEWSIAPAGIEAAKVDLTPSSFVCDDKAKEPTAKVTLAGKELAADTDYEMAYKNNVNVGTATVTATGKGNYKGSASATFAIAPGKPSITVSLKASLKKAVVKWNTVAGAKSYQLQRRAKGGKWKTIKTTKTKKTIKRLKRGKLYEFRVRAVAGNAEGPWSDINRCWTKKVARASVKASGSGALKVT